MRLTLAGHAGSPDVDLDVADGVRLGALRPDLATASGRPELAGAAGRPPVALAVDDVVLGDEHVTGCAPLVPGAVLRSGAGAPDPERAALAARWHLAVVGGPDSGALVALDAAGVVLGRSPGPPGRGPGSARHVRLDDPALSARQAEIRPGRRAPRARDLASRNGTRLIRRRRPGRPVRLRRRARTLAAGDRLVLGATTVEVRSASAAVGAVGPAADRPRAPRVPPTGAGPAGWAAPAAGALVLAAATGNRMLLALAVIGPATSLAGAAAGRCADLLRAVRVTRPWATRRAAAPVEQHVALPCAADLRTDLLHRVAGASAEPPATTGGDRAGRSGPGPEVGAGATGGTAAPAGTAGTIGAASATPPVPTPAAWHALAPQGCLAVAGPRRVALGVVRLLACAAVAEAAGPPGRARLPPGTVAPGGIEVVPPGDAEAWRWARWVPAAGRPTVVVVDGGHHAAVTARPGVPALVVLAEGDAVPSWCTAVLTVGADAGPARLTGPGTPTRTVEVAGVSAAWAERHARLLHATTRAVDGGPTGPPAPPPLVPLADLPGVPRPDAAAVLHAWAATGTPAHPAPGLDGGLRAVLGRGRDGVPVVVDLVRDGPHGLVAGTTGAGKSGLLQTWVLSLALTHSPADLAVLLVDYKGGAGFGACAGLPHVAGLVTDLDEATAARALTGLRAELRRREHVLARWSVPDLAALRATSPASAPPRLLVVVDEFRTLVDDLPEFVPGLLRVAAQGRSLGVHLLLATQRPGGAVGPDLRANLAVRVALRVTGAAESHDVIDVPDAAAIPADAVGRALLRRGPAAPEPLQVAHADAPPAARRALARRVEAEGVALAPGRTAAATTSGPAPGVDAWVEAARAAARAAGLARTDPPWLPPLPADLTLVELARHGTAAAEPTGRDPRLLLALADHPEHRRQTVVGWDPRCGPLLVVGAALSGRTTALRTLATGALDRGWHVHLVCASLPPDVPSAHPGCGTVVGADDPRRVARLLTVLTGPHPQLVLVDGIEAVLDGLATVAHGRGADALLDALRDGRRRGLAVAATASAGLSQQVARLFADRLVLRLDDPFAESLAGVPARVSAPAGPPGRGTWLPAGGARTPADAVAGPAPCQVARVPGTGPLPAPAQAASPSPGPAASPSPEPAGSPPPGPAASPHPGRAAPPALRILPVPERVEPSDLDRALATAPGGADAAGAWLPVGLGGDDAGPVGLLPAPGALVVGPAGSGRSTALAAAALAALRSGARLAVVARDGVLRDLGTALVPASTCGHAPAAVARVLADVARPGAHGRVVVVVDDLDALEPRAPEVSAALADLLDPVEDGAGSPHRSGGPGPRVLVVASARTGAAATAFRGPLAALRAQRSGLVLSPAEPGSAEVFGVDLAWAADPGRPHLPGRGVGVQGRDVTPVQVVHAVASTVATVTMVAERDGRARRPRSAP